MRKLYAMMLVGLLASVNTQAQTSPYLAAVDEYVPAPGQFINTLPALSANDTPATAAQKCTENLAGKMDGMVSLGAYGGYITFHFDHPVVNVSGAKDLYLKGNAFPGSSEPGIVMVAQDTNGNGLPDDEWFELSGSADVDSLGKVVYDYEITYTKTGEKQDIAWTDNQGKQGFVNRNQFHDQEYFPLWLGNSLTFKGTLLPPNYVNRGKNGGQFWYGNAFRDGYVDNQKDKENSLFDLDNAVDQNRQPVHLRYVDFIRVYCATNQMAGWLGEISTEFCGAEDLHPTVTSLERIENSKAIVQKIFTIDGKEIPSLQKGFNIVRFTNGKIQKILKK